VPLSTPPTDEAFADWLAAYDESLAGGRDTDPVVEPTTPPNARASRISSCLARLETLWPRAPLRPASAPTLDEIARLRDDELRGRRFGRFIIEREMGRGGHGVVFLAVDPVLKRKVALKVPRPDVLVTADLRRRFLREAQAAAVLDHPNIVSIFETGETGPACYLAAAYCNGPTLGEWMQRRSSTIPPRQAALIALRMAEALQHAHDKQIFHRDFKPSNILLEPRNIHPFTTTDEGLPFTPKLTDFGLAKVVEEGCGDETRTGAILGTPRYMSPEQAEGRLKEIGPATDVHGVGVTLYEMLAGQPPYMGAGDGETLHLVRTADPTPPSKHRDGIPRDLEAICLKCLEKEIDRRYPTALALAEDLRRFLADQPTLARPIRWPDRVLRWARREPMGAAFFVGCMLAVVSISSAWVWYTLKVHAAAELAASFGREVNERDRALRGELAATELQLAVGELQAGREVDARTRLAKLHRERHAVAALGSALQRVKALVRAVESSNAIPLPAVTQRWTSASLAPDGGSVLGIGDAGTIERFDLDDRRLRWRLERDGASAAAVDWRWSPDGCRVAGRHAHERLFIVDRQGEMLFDGVSVGDVALPCDRRSRFLYLAVDRRRGLLGVQSNGSIRSLPSGRDDYSDAVLFADESAVLLLRRRGGVKVVDLRREEVTLALPTPALGEWRRLALDPSNRWGAAVSSEGGVAFWDLRTGKRWNGDLGLSAGATVALRFLDDAKTLVHAASDGRLTAWHVPTGRRFFDASLKDAAVFTATFDEQRLRFVARADDAPRTPMTLHDGAD
jgi:hypothetical protein